MGYQEELARLQEAKASMRQSIINKGVEVPEDARIEDYPEYIAQITTTPPEPELTDWGVLYTTEYPDGVELTESDYAKLGNANSVTHTLNFSFGNVVKSTITGFDFGTQPTAIPPYFLTECTNLTHLSSIPDTVTSIGLFFLFDCNQFAEPLTLPSSITAISSYFMGFCDRFVGPLTVGCSPPGAHTSILATSNMAAPMYQTGVTLLGAQAEAWIARLPNSNSSPYRKLILG